MDEKELEKKLDQFDIISNTIRARYVIHKVIKNLREKPLTQEILDAVMEIDAHMTSFEDLIDSYTEVLIELENLSDDDKKRLMADH